MILHLTDNELMALGYDEPHARDNPDQVRSIVAKTGRKNRQPLTDDELARIKSDCRYLPGPGESDPPIVRAATRLRNKVYGDE